MADLQPALAPTPPIRMLIDSMLSKKNQCRSRASPSLSSHLVPTPQLPSVHPTPDLPPMMGVIAAGTSHQPECRDCPAFLPSLLPSSQPTDPASALSIEKMMYLAMTHTIHRTETAITTDLTLLLPQLPAPPRAPQAGRLQTRPSLPQAAERHHHRLRRHAQRSQRRHHHR